MSAPGLPLVMMVAPLGMCKLPPTSAVPAALLAAVPCFVGRTPAELSIVAPLADLAACGLRSELAFRLLRIDLTFGVTESGVLKRLLDPLAEAQIWVLALGNHDTDYLLLREDQAGAAVRALVRAGHQVTEGA